MESRPRLQPRLPGHHPVKNSFHMKGIVPFASQNILRVPADGFGRSYTCTGKMEKLVVMTKIGPAGVWHKYFAGAQTSTKTVLTKFMPKGNQPRLAQWRQDG